MLPAREPPPCQTIVPQSILERIASENAGRPDRLATDGLRGLTPDWTTLLDRDAEWEGAWAANETAVTLPLLGLISDGNRCSQAAREALR